MSDHPAIAARRRRVHRIRTRIAAVAVGLFIAVFSVVYAQMPAAAGAKAAQRKSAQKKRAQVAAAPAQAATTAEAPAPTPVTTSQS
jgi:hypothetical protein